MADEGQPGESSMVGEGSIVLYIELPEAKIVLLQGLFELYEGIGVVRTVDAERSIASVLTTPSMLPECRALLESLRQELGWREVPAEIGRRADTLTRD